MSATTKAIEPGEVMESMYNISALGKTIATWAANQPATIEGCLEVDVGDVLSMSNMIVREASQLLARLDSPSLVFITKGGAV